MRKPQKLLAEGAGLIMELRKVFTDKMTQLGSMSLVTFQLEEDKKNCFRWQKQNVQRSCGWRRQLCVAGCIFQRWLPGVSHLVAFLIQITYSSIKRYRVMFSSFPCRQACDHSRHPAKYASLLSRFLTAKPLCWEAVSLPMEILQLLTETIKGAASGDSSP